MMFSRWCSRVDQMTRISAHPKWATSLLAVALIAFDAHAEDDWWFDVEVIAFKRNLALTELEEQFTLAKDLLAPRAQADIISDVIAPDISWLKQGLKVCDLDTHVKWHRDYEGALKSMVPAPDVDFLSLPALPDVDNSLPIKENVEFAQENLSENAEENLVSGNSESDLEKVFNDLSDVAEATSQVTENSLPIGEVAVTPLTATELGDEQTEPNEGASEDEGEWSAEQSWELQPETIAQYWLWFYGLPESAENDSQTDVIHIPPFRYCEPIKPWISAETDRFTLNNLPVWKVNKTDNRLPSPPHLPVVIEGHDWPLSAKAHLLTSNQQSLSAISRQIRASRDLERLFHVTWRQPVMFSKENAFDVRLFGGKNYATEFALSGEQRQRVHTLLKTTQNETLASGLSTDNDAVHRPALPVGEQVDTNQLEVNKAQFEEQSALIGSDIFADLQRRLAQPEYIPFSEFQALDLPLLLDDAETESTQNGALRTPIWEIDGTMKVFLKYINRVPYLHIDSQLFYRQPVPVGYFKNSPELNSIATSQIDTQSTNVDNANSIGQNPPSAVSSTPLEYQLVSVPLGEQRRVISTQLHYFDHPLFGFIVQIRRYHRPEPQALDEH
ncbi:hypothetical protein D210916BOD24_18110 [Alteromonas sp. D210916BOD_24]|uniref:CsiV family protein n=1 Tax=Alteromonas sp. D210916BOD_24 TaxID=3157618 RepID=UPI00399C76FE